MLRGRMASLHCPTPAAPKQARQAPPGETATATVRLEKTRSAAPSKKQTPLPCAPPCFQKPRHHCQCLWARRTEWPQALRANKSAAAAAASVAPAAARWSAERRLAQARKRWPAAQAEREAAPRRRVQGLPTRCNRPPYTRPPGRPLPSPPRRLPMALLRTLLKTMLRRVRRRRLRLRTRRRRRRLKGGQKELSRRPQRAKRATGQAPFEVLTQES
jgi:hypothetical protein